MFFGCHLSASAGNTAMVKTALSIGADTFAFFTRNPRGSKAKKEDPADCARAVAMMKEYAFGPLVAHGAYTMNLCTADPEARAFAAEVLSDDLRRMAALPGQYYNFHPGSHVGQGTEQGIEYIAAALKQAMSHGYPVTVLAREIEEYLGISEKNEAVLVGVGKLGQALLEYNGFSEFGLTITTGFDVRKEIVGTQIGGKPILNASDMENYVRENGTTMGILTVPAKYAQETANNLVKAGIKAIWNFSPTHIVVPETVAVKNENLAASLAVLSKQIKEKNKIL